MSPSRHCPSCSTELDPTDRFCPSCGREAAVPDTPTIPKTCPLCGQINAPGAESCAVCGAKIGRAPEKVSQPARKTAPATGGASLFQSWKFTAGVGA
ncbi:MAG TPA: zinc ribbon domain-containing protein, partial [Bacteroidota bacterium]|nr:zinc ribbon domain-containing protein [Bacteroidota bacterium]